MTFVFFFFKHYPGLFIPLDRESRFPPRHQVGNDDWCRQRWRQHCQNKWKFKKEKNERKIGFVASALNVTIPVPFCCAFSFIQQSISTRTSRFIRFNTKAQRSKRSSSSGLRQTRCFQSSTSNTTKNTPTASVSKSRNGKKVNRIAALRKTNTPTTVAVMVV